MLCVEVQHHHPPCPKLSEQSTPPTFSSISGNDELEKEFKASEAQLNAYHQVLKEVFSSLDTKQIEKFIYLCEEATLSVRSNPDAPTLLSFLKQRSLISPVNLEYLQIRLQTCGQSELCELIDEYTRKYLDEQPPSLPQGN